MECIHEVWGAVERNTALYKQPCVNKCLRDILPDLPNVQSEMVYVHVRKKKLFGVRVKKKLLGGGALSIKGRGIFPPPWRI